MATTEPQGLPPDLGAPLNLRFSALPLVLAGPILRHVSSSSVTVWLALRRPKQVRLSIFDPVSGNVRFQSNTLTTLEVGKNLHLIAVTASTTDPALQLVPATLYVYNVQFTAVPGDEDGRSGDLLTNGFVVPEGAPPGAAGDLLSFGALGLPSFALPPNQVTQLRILHGSCRKPHADSIDALASAHDLLAEKPGQPPSQAPARFPLQRPHQLFLTGDQIYADDVGSILLAMIMDAAPLLLGVDEPLPGLNQNGTDGTTARFGPWNRGGRIGISAGFTSGASQSHLMSFGEYAAMYLFAWSDVLWQPGDLPDYAEVFPSVPAQETYFAKGEKLTKDSWALEKDKVERPALESFRLSLPRVRRVLANVPTYMIFDDHDVTDDWFMNRAACEKVIGTSSGSPSRLGVRIIQNALTAYALFQSWGNEGDAPGQPMSKVRPPFEAWRTGGFKADSPSLTDLSNVLGLPTGRLPVPQSRGEIAKLPISAEAVNWNYSHRWAGHEVIAVDSRTRRGYPRSRSASAAQIAEDEIARQVALPLDPSLENKVTFVLVPGPLMTVPVQEDLQSEVTTEKDSFTRDVEVWGFDQTSLETLLATLATRGNRNRRVVLLSGDVHYGFSYRLQYWAQKPLVDPASPARAVFALMTSSALKNESDAPPTRILHRTGFITLAAADRRFNMRLIWKADPSARDLRVGRVSTAPGIRIRARVDREVAVIPSLSRELFRHAVGASGGHIVFETQPDSVLLSTLLHSTDARTAPGDDLPDKPLDLTVRAVLFGVAMSKFKDVYYDTLRPGSELVGLNNLALITFTEKPNPTSGGNDLYAVQELFWRTGEPGALYSRQKEGTLPPTGDPRTRLEVSLTFEDPPAL